MKSVVKSLLPVTLAAVALWCAVRAHAAEQRVSTQTAAASSPQVVEGKKRFAEKCARCHGPEADGIEHAPALKGDAFKATWNGKAARELYKRIISTMPQDDPGSLPEPDVIQITAFVAALNSAVLPAVQKANDLNTIKLELAK